MTFGPEFDLQTDLDGDLLTRAITVTPFKLDLHTQDSFGSDVIWTRERLDLPFGISRSLPLPVGVEYECARWRLRGDTANRRILALNWRFEDGAFYSGTRRQTVLNFTVRIAPGYIVYLNSEWNDVTLREGRFTSNVFRFIGETQFSPYVTLVNNVQYDTVSRVAGLQSRFRWIMKPGNDLYVVYNHNWIDDPILNRFTSLDRRLASKILYTHRF